MGRPSLPSTRPRSMVTPIFRRTVARVFSARYSLPAGLPATFLTAASGPARPISSVPVLWRYGDDIRARDRFSTTTTIRWPIWRRFAKDRARSALTVDAHDNRTQNYPGDYVRRAVPGQYRDIDYRGSGADQGRQWRGSLVDYAWYPRGNAGDGSPYVSPGERCVRRCRGESMQGVLWRWPPLNDPKASVAEFDRVDPGALTSARCLQQRQRRTTLRS